MRRMRKQRPDSRFPARLAVAGGIVALIVVVGVGAALAGQGPGELPPAKATAAAVERQALATAQANRQPKEGFGYTPVPTPESYPRPASGILNAHDGPASWTEFQQRNVWQGPVANSDRWLQVNAGILVNPDGSLGQAAVILQTMIPDPKDGNYQYTIVGTVTAPTHSGALKIIAENAGVLQLQTDGGETVYFDLQARSFRTS
jgi:hypothetical protein